jgi:hypothetical protein
MPQPMVCLHAEVRQCASLWQFANTIFMGFYRSEEYSSPR